MTTEAILKPIGNGQITIPQDWRKAMGIDKKHVRARFEGNRVIIEPLEKKKVDLDIREIQLNELNEETIECIKEGEENRKKGIKNLSFNDFFGNV